MPHSKRPSQEDKDLLVTKARNITDVVVACRETGLEWFEQLLDTLFKPKEDKDDATKKNTEASPMLVLACQQIVDCLVESVLRMEESTSEMPSADPMAAVTGKPAGSISASKRLVACLTTLYLFAKIRPQLLVEHVQVTYQFNSFRKSVTCPTLSQKGRTDYVMYFTWYIRGSYYGEEETILVLIKASFCFKKLTKASKVQNFKFLCYCHYSMQNH